MANLSLDMPAGKGGRGGGRWDQFEANRKMFQGKSACQDFLEPLPDGCVHVHMLSCMPILR